MKYHIYLDGVWQASFREKNDAEHYYHIIQSKHHMDGDVSMTEQAEDSDEEERIY